MQQIFKYDLKYYRIVLNDGQKIHCEYDPTVKEYQYLDLRFVDIVRKLDDAIIFSNALAQTLNNIQDNLGVSKIKIQLEVLEEKIVAQGDTIVKLSERIKTIEKLNKEKND